MDSLNWLRLPSEGASSPRRWSYSSLSVWRACPRQWWLMNSRYDNVPDGRYPLPLGVAAVEGRIVHAGIEALLNFRREGKEATFNARQFAKRYLQDLLRDEISRNPRVDAGRIGALVSLDSCLARFFALARDLPPASGSLSPIVSDRYNESVPPSYAAEVWIEVDDPPVAARIDNVIDGTITDFKTGEPDPDRHRDQLRLYALLWWLRFRMRPRRLVLRYGEQTHEIEVPSDATLSEMAEGLRSELQAIGQTLVSPPPAARPAVDTCRYCPVRQLCADYWNSEHTAVLRTAQNLAAGVTSNATPFRDIRLSQLPPHWRCGQPLAGVAEADGIGPVTINIGSRFSPGQNEPLPSGGRLLNVLLLHENNGAFVKFTSASEVFWEQRLGP